MFTTGRHRICYKYRSRGKSRGKMHIVPAVSRAESGCRKFHIKTRKSSSKGGSCTYARNSPSSLRYETFKVASKNCFDIGKF